jgi:hypothetical protein
MNKDQLSKVIESTVVSISASIPIAASFATGWTEYRNHMQEKNVIEIIRAFLERLKFLEEKVDYEYIKSSDFKSLTVKACINGMDEVHEEKRKYLSNFLANSCILENSKEPIKNSILETLMKLSQFDLKVLKVLYEGVEGDFGEVIRGKKKFDLSFAYIHFDENHVSEQFPEYNELEVRITLQYLESLGVIENTITRTFNRNLSKDIDDHLRYTRLNEIMNRINELYSTWRSEEAKKELVELNKEQEVLKNGDMEFIERNYNKTYVISSLGVKVLDYILK